MEDIPTVHPKSRAAWRTWLAKNHNKKTKVALVKYKKHTGKPTISHQEAMDEAICFGWIDTTVNRLDDERYIRRFAKRTKKSRWSNATQRYAKRLIKEGRMTPAGLEAYQWGLKHPVIDHGLPKNPPIPADLKKALTKSKKAQQHFTHFAPSYKRFYIYWIEKAKLPETRKRRIADVYQRALENKKPGL